MFTPMVVMLGAKYLLVCGQTPPSLISCGKYQFGSVPKKHQVTEDGLLGLRH
jgi:hypothetical protein